MNADVDLVRKPWGTERMFTTHDFILKIITINQGHRTSLQYHRRKEELIHVLSGSGGVHIYPKDKFDPQGNYMKVGEGERVFIPPMNMHRSVGPVTLLEITSLENDDVVRVSDDYDRKIEIYGAE